MSNLFKAFQLPKKRNFFMMAKGSQLFKYSFLESSAFNQELKNNKYGAKNPQLSSLLQTDFTSSDILNSSLLKDIVDQRKQKSEQASKRFVNSKKITLQEYQESTKELIMNNMLSIETWRSIFHEVLWINFPRWENTEWFSKVLVHLGIYIHKFPSELHTYKFNIDKYELNTVLPFKDAIITLFEKKKKMEDLEAEVALFKVIRTVAAKIDINMKAIRNYYTRNVSQLEKLLDGKDLEVVLSMNRIYNTLSIQPQYLKSFWQSRIQPLIEGKQQLSKEEFMGLAGLDLNKAFLKEKMPLMLRVAKQNHLQSVLLSNLLQNRIYEPQYIEPLLNQIPFEKQNIIKRNSLHQCLHHLSIKGYNIQSHKRLVDSVAKECSKTHPEILKVVNKNTLIKSSCLGDKHEGPAKRTYRQNSIESWCSQVIQQRFKDRYKVLVGENFCSYQLDIVLIDKEGRVFVVEIKGTHYSDENGEVRLKKQLKLDLLKHYGFNVIFLSTTERRQFEFFKNKQEDALVSFIEAEISIASG